MTNNQIYYTNGGGDEQYTPAKTVEILLPHIQHLKDKIIWCPFDREDSQFVRVLRENGFNTICSHIDYGQDFFEYEPEHWDVIISNPPYTNKRRYWERCLDLGKPFALLLPVNILSDSVINVSLRERERERGICNSSFSFLQGELGSTMRKPARLASRLHSKLRILLSIYSSNKLYWQICRRRINERSM